MSEAERAMLSDVLMVSPVVPRPTGTGVERRASATLISLAHRSCVHLVILPALQLGGDLPEELGERAERVLMLPTDDVLDIADRRLSAAGDALTGQALTVNGALPEAAPHFSRQSAFRIAAWAHGLDFAAVHVFRLSMAPLVHPLVRASSLRRPWAVLDLDDDEEDAFRMLADIARQGGQAESADVLEAEARRIAAFRTEAIQGFDALTVASPLDQARLAARHPGVDVSVLPNIYAGDEINHEPSRDGPLRVLFVGAMGYPPNADAALTLCRTILPLLRAAWPVVEVILVGPDAPEAVKLAAAAVGASYLGAVLRLEPYYAQADVAVVPLRAGSGTRIKILEAFAHRVPVVSTALGASGLEARDGEHLLLAETGEAFASACLRIKRDPQLAIRLTSAGADLLARAYSPDALLAAMARLYAPVWNSTSPEVGRPCAAGTGERKLEQ